MNNWNKFLFLLTAQIILKANSSAYFKIDSIIQTQSQIFYPIITSNHFTVYMQPHLNAFFHMSK